MMVDPPQKIYRAVVSAKALDELIEDPEAPLPDDVSHRFKRVLRLSEGDQVEVLDGSGSVMKGQLAYRDENAYLDKPTFSKEGTELPPLYLAQALIRPNKLEPLIQKATEMGVTRIILWSAERSEARWYPEAASKKRARLEKIALEATRQSQRTTSPVIEGPYDRSALNSLLAKMPEAWFVAHPAADQWVSTALQGLTSDILSPLGIIIGPEGGLSDEELSEFHDLGIQETRLSPHTLRTETAAFPFLCAVQWLRGRL